MDKILKELEIRHYKIRPRTPEHNGKVERSHRNDKVKQYIHESVRVFNIQGKRAELELAVS